MKKDKLEGSEKIIVWVASIVNPIIAGLLFYSMWKKNFPKKARQANIISFVVALVEIAGYVFYKVATQQPLA